MVFIFDRYKRRISYFYTTEAVSSFFYFLSMSTTITSAAAASAGIASTQRDFIRVDLSDFETRKDEIVKTIMKASTHQGFFYGKFE